MTTNIPGIGLPPPVIDQTQPVEAVAPDKEPEQDDADLQQDAAVIRTLAASPPVLAYGPGGTTNADDQYAQLQRLVSASFIEQGMAAELAVSDDETKAIEDISAEEAAELISEDGYWGVAQTSERIVNFAIEMTDADPERVQEVRDGLLEGFAAAKEALGGFLPEISEQTIATVLEQYDVYAAGLLG